MNKLISKAVFLASALALVIASAASLADPPNKAGFIYTANERDASISEIALASGKVRTFKTPIVPHNVQVTPDGAWLLAVGSAADDHQKHDAHKASAEDEGGKLLVFDVRNPGKAIATLPAGKHPAHVVTDREGRRAFVTSSEENAITVVDLTQKRVVGKIGTGASPHGLRASPDGRELYVANVADGTVSVVDIATLKEVARLPVGKAPVQVGFTPDGSQAYVSLRDENRVAVIDVGSRKLIGKIDVGRNPIQVYASPDGKSMYVANQGSNKAWGNNVSVVDIASRRVVATVTTGAGAHGVVVDGRSGTAFVSNIEAGTVSAIDPVSRQVTASYKVGSGPNGIAYRPE